MTEPTELTTQPTKLVEMSVDVVAAYVANNSLPPSEIAQLIETVHGTLHRIATKQETPETAKEQLTPAVPVKKSITTDYLICLEDGKPFKSLKRHLNTTYNMTPDEYRAKWGLASDYPMVAPAYAAKRSELAKTMGLGSNRLKKKPTRPRA